MHESVATALYRGYERKVNGIDMNRIYQRLGRLPNKRAAWLRGALKGLKAIPGMVVFEPQVTGQGRHASARTILVSLEKETSGRSGWYASGMTLSARDFSMDTFDLPILVTHHLVQRTMQRLNVESPVAAIRSLQPAIFAALWLGEPHADSSVLLPAFGGAVVTVQDRVDPWSWALVTFVDAAKLTDKQHQQLEFWYGKAHQKLVDWVDSELAKPPAERDPQIAGLEQQAQAVYASA